MQLFLRRISLVSHLRGQTIATRLVVILLLSLVSILQTNQETTTTSNIDYNSNYGFCNISNISRLSLITQFQGAQQVTERAITCSQVDEKNYLHMVKSIYKSPAFNIQQIEITHSDPLVVFPAIDLICERFNCSKLTVFNVTGQKIQDYSVLSKWIDHWPQLEILDLSNTSLVAIESIQSVVLQSLTTLQLDYNNISEVNFEYILDRMPRLKHLSLVNNTVFNINCNESLRSRVRSQLETISLAGNYINCDRRHLWLMKQFQTLNENLKFPEYDKINCSLPKKFQEMNWSQRISVYETPLCDDCECMSLKKAISVTCHNKNLTRLPVVLPLTTKVLNLTNNRISSLEIPHNSKNWENVTYIHLENNLLTSFQPLEMNTKLVRNLVALDIRRNKFQEFPNQLFKHFIHLDQIHLSNNPWLCDCEPTYAFQEWLQRQFHKVGDKEEIMCGISGSEENGVRSYNLDQRLASKIIYRLSKSELCPQDNLVEPYGWLDVVNILLGLTIILIVVKVTVDYVYQHRTKRLPHFFQLNFFCLK